MKSLGKLKYTFLIAAVILILMIIRSGGSRAWKGHVNDAAEMIASGKYLMDVAELPELQGQVTLVRLGDAISDSLLLSYHLPQKQMVFGDLTGKEKLKELNAAWSRLIIVSHTPAEGVKAWVMLNQMGVKNLFVLSGLTGEGETLKYQFRPDSTFRPEPEPSEN